MLAFNSTASSAIALRFKEIARAMQSLAELIETSPSPGPTHYTSKNLPEGCPSRRAFATACRGILEARLTGRCWSCPVDVWHDTMQRAPIVRAPIESPLQATARRLGVVL